MRAASRQAHTALSDEDPTTWLDNGRRLEEMLTQQNAVKVFVCEKLTRLNFVKIRDRWRHGDGNSQRHSERACARDRLSRRQAGAQALRQSMNIYS